MQAPVKGDKYEIWEDTYDEPYPEEPETATVYKISDPQDLPDTGDEFVFFKGKPVLFLGYEFSKVKKETYFRGWEYNEEGEVVGKKEEKQGTEEVKVKATEGSDFVYIDGIPMSVMEGGVTGGGAQYAMVNGRLVKVGESSVSGEFTECSSNVFMES